MNKIEVRSNTEFSQPYCAYLKKTEFCRHKIQKGKIIRNITRNGFLYSGVTVKMHSPKIALPSNHLPGNKSSPVLGVLFSRVIIIPGVIFYGE